MSSPGQRRDLRSPDREPLCSAPSLSVRFQVGFLRLNPMHTGPVQPAVKGPHSSPSSLVSRAASGLCGEGSRDSVSGSDVGSSPGLGHMPAETPGLQPARKAPPATIALSAILCREKTGSLKPVQSPDGFSLKTLPENLGDPRQHGWWQSPAFGEPAALLPWACASPSVVS